MQERWHLQGATRAKYCAKQMIEIHTIFDVGIQLPGSTAKRNDGQLASKVELKVCSLCKYA